jgi:hypothetical protein
VNEMCCMQQVDCVYRCREAAKRACSMILEGDLLSFLQQR